MVRKSYLLAFPFLFLVQMLSAQPQDRWQQRAEYEMEIDFNVNKHQFTGQQKLTYYNNSPDDLNRVFYHLYFNAFQPNSMMDVRSRTISDPDSRVRDRINKLSEEEMGYHRIRSLTCNGQPTTYEVNGTILEVDLPESIKAGEKAVFEMEFESQVPIQIRRSGRDNAEGISYSMTQWYPKLCEYDYQGWHANPYVGREFHGVWGDFDVKITIDRDFVLGGTGYLQNATEIGCGYEKEGEAVNRPKGKTLTWHFKAPNVHDFMWAADPDYKHTKLVREDGITLHFLYEENKDTEEVWARLPSIMDKALDFVEEKYGEYPFEQYSFIQGGDGGMEYPMGTLITGKRNLGSLVGVSVHELMHSWYQMVLGVNESLYPWIDEGFTSYTSLVVMNELRRQGLLPGQEARQDPFRNTYAGYNNLVKSGLEEPLTTHADHFQTNYAYAMAAYTKGSVFLHQLEYVIGEDAFDAGMLKFYDTWKFKHPNVNDFIRVMEKESGLELDWYKEYWIQTTHVIDYGIAGVEEEKGGNTVVTLERLGAMPMPIDLEITYRSGKKEIVTIPLRVMRGAKAQERSRMDFRVAEDWPWTHPTYELVIPVAMDQIRDITIDGSMRLADIERANNTWNTNERK